jgi:hypothetical protein
MVEVPDEHATCTRLCQALGGPAVLESLQRFNAEAPRLETCDANGGDDFPIIAEHGYIAYAYAPHSQMLRTALACISFELLPDTNLIGHPRSKAGESIDEKAI